MKKIISNKLSVILIAFVCILSDAVSGGDIPSEGKNLPDMRIQSPVSQKDKDYLGIGNQPDFGIEEINARVVIMEIVGVYCPKCHIQNPKFNQLFNRIEKNKKLREQVKIIAIAAGATQIEVDYWIKQYQAAFPVFADPKYDLHKLLGEPRTPYTMVITDRKKVAFAHFGVIEDIDSLFLRIQNLVP
jgi:hypothetical protein